MYVYVIHMLYTFIHIHILYLLHNYIIIFAYSYHHNVNRVKGTIHTCMMYVCKCVSVLRDYTHNTIHNISMYFLLCVFYYFNIKFI